MYISSACPCLHLRVVSAAVTAAAACPLALLSCRQMCSLQEAQADFESVIKLKPSHSSAAKELSSLSDLQAAFEQLQALQQAHADAAGVGQRPDVTAARQVLDKVYGLAPDCIPAQLLDAQLEMLAGNYEQVGLCWCVGCV